jgi:hypothetical protein
MKWMECLNHNLQHDTTGYTLNTSHEHGFHLANRFGMTHEHYEALLVAADLARYVNGVLTIKIKQWESFLHGYYFSDSLVEHAIEEKKEDVLRWQ